MRFLLGFFAGLGAAWAALAIWQRVPPLGPIDASDDVDPALVPDVEPWPTTLPGVADGSVAYIDEWVPRRRGDRRPGFDASVAGGSLADVMPLGARRIPPVIHTSGCLGHVGGICTCGVL